ncbi:MAG: hypothetical protein ABEJ03_01140 [Candidatus Nanohaloarchaea archaeon]
MDALRAEVLDTDSYGFIDRDTPASIGPTEPETTNSERVRFFPSLRITDEEDLDTVVEEAVEAFDASEATRIGGRLLVSDEISSQLYETDISLDVEGTVELDGDWNDSSLVYLGSNTGRRNIPLHDILDSVDYSPRDIFNQSRTLGEQVDNLDILERSPSNLPEADRYARLGDNYHVALNPDLESDRIDQIVEFYQGFEEYPFEIDREMVRGWLDDVMAIGMYQDEDTEGYEIASALVGETATLPIYDPESNEIREFTLSESSDALTREEHGGNGLFTAAGVMMFEYLLRDREVDLAYGETRAASESALRGAAAMGRDFYGMCPEKVYIGGRGEQLTDSDYETLVVNGLTPGEISSDRGDLDE